MNAGAAARSILHRLGFDVIRYPAGTSWGTSLRRVLEETRPDVLVDVGACRGAFSDHCRALGFRGPVVSFEPAAAQADALARRAAADPSWTVRRLALADEPGEAELHLGEDALLSSLLRPRPAALAAYAGLRGDRTERVPVARLDGVLDQLAAGATRVFLKIDTQGSDLRVLRGATAVLDRVVALHVELSVQPVYEGSPDYLEVLAWVREHGFEPVEIVSRATLGPLLAEADCLLRRVP